MSVDLQHSLQIESQEKNEKKWKIVLKKMYVQQTDHHGALACERSGTLSGISFVCLGSASSFGARKAFTFP